MQTVGLSDAPVRFSICAVLLGSEAALDFVPGVFLLVSALSFRWWSSRLRLQPPFLRIQLFVCVFLLALSPVLFPRFRRFRRGSKPSLCASIVQSANVTAGLSADKLCQTFCFLSFGLGTHVLCVEITSLFAALSRIMKTFSTNN